MSSLRSPICPAAGVSLAARILHRRARSSGAGNSPRTPDGLRSIRMRYRHLNRPLGMVAILLLLFVLVVKLLRAARSLHLW